MQIKDLWFKKLVQLVILGAVIVTVKLWAKAVLIPLGPCSIYQRIPSLHQEHTTPSSRENYAAFRAAARAAYPCEMVFRADAGPKLQLRE